MGPGKADLVAVEPNGRLAVIEVKLRKNQEARRAVVAQVLSYASYLYGISVTDLQERVLASHLANRGLESVWSATLAAGGASDSADSRAIFEEALGESLQTGRFRLVLVLDEAPPDLVSLVGYLEEVTDRLVIDLVTVAAYEVGEQRLVIPSRVEPGNVRADKALPRQIGSTQETGGIDEFRLGVASASPAQKVLMDRATAWAADLESRGLAKLMTTKGAVLTLRVYVPGDMSLVTVNGWTSLQLFRSVFDRRAPRARAKLEAVLGKPIGLGTALHDLPEAVLALLTEAYEEAASGRLAVDSTQEI